MQIQIDGGLGGNHIAYYTSSAVAVTIDLTTNVNIGGEAEGDRIVGVERIYGSSFNDSITGDTASNTLYGHDGTDTLSGGVGNDYLYGGTGDDTLIGGAGADQLNGDGGIDTASYAGSAAGVTVNLTLATAQVSGGDASGDVLTGISNLIGSSAADVLIGNQAANQIIGGLGGDSIFGGNGADILDGGDGVDAVIYTYSSVGVVVNLLTNIQSGGEADGDNLFKHRKHNGICLW